MARSSVVPGGGASPESALHVLSECRGDFLVKSHLLFGQIQDYLENNNSLLKPASDYICVSDQPSRDDDPHSDLQLTINYKYFIFHMEIYSIPIFPPSPQRLSLNKSFSILGNCWFWSDNLTVMTSLQEVTHSHIILFNTKQPSTQLP